MSENNEPTPDGGDPNTVRELQKARGDLVSLRAELKAIRGERDSAITERDDAIKSRDGYKGQIEKQKGEFETKITELTEAATQANTEREAAVASVRTASDQAVIRAEAKAAAVRMGAVNAEDVVALTDLSTVTRGEDGSIAGLDEAMAAAKEARSYLFGEAPKPGAVTGNTSSQQAPKPGAVSPVNARELDSKDYAASREQFLTAK